MCCAGATVEDVECLYAPHAEKLPKREPEASDPEPDAHDHVERRAVISVMRLVEYRILNKEY